MTRTADTSSDTPILTRGRAVPPLFDKISFVAKKLFGRYKRDDEVSQENDKIIFPAWRFVGRELAYPEAFVEQTEQATMALCQVRHLKYSQNHRHFLHIMTIFWH